LPQIVDSIVGKAQKTRIRPYSLI